MMIRGNFQATALRSNVLRQGFCNNHKITVLRSFYYRGNAKNVISCSGRTLSSALAIRQMAHHRCRFSALVNTSIPKRSCGVGATSCVRSLSSINSNPSTLNPVNKFFQDSTKESSSGLLGGIGLACGAIGISLLSQLSSSANNRTRAEASESTSERELQATINPDARHWENNDALALSVKKDIEEDDEETTATTLLNWSGTHEIHLDDGQYYEPETVEEVEQLIKTFYKTNTPFRPVGSALSPNAIGFHYTERRSKTQSKSSNKKRGDKSEPSNKKTGAMINLVHLDKILRVDKENMTVTVQAGARVSQVIDALRPHGLTLPNLASIAEQQIGGFIQVGAHGTGARISPVDDFCTSLTMVTPFMGTVTLQGDKSRPRQTKKQLEGNQRLQQHLSETLAHAPSLDPLFHISKVGLGSLGIVTEVTLQCIPAHNLVEHTYVLTRQQAKDQIKHLLKKHKHIRYMWIPYADSVVVVTNDPEDSIDRSVLTEALEYVNAKKVASKEVLYSQEQKKLKPFSNLLLETSDTFNKIEDVEGMGFDVLRDQCLIAKDPLDVEHVKRCNQAEAEFWRNSEGYQIKPSDQLLQFECGGQQWVKEMCFPTGTYANNNGNDMAFVEALLEGIEREGIPAHTPIEQRWSCGSSSFMSPAYEPNDPQEALFSWVGIIMYLPNAEDKVQRADITNVFKGKYCHLMEDIGYKVHAATHWAKLELPTTDDEVRSLQKHMKLRFPVNYFNHARYTFDPTNLMSNDLINASFGDPADSETMGNIANKPKF